MNWKGNYMTKFEEKYAEFSSVIEKYARVAFFKQRKPVQYEIDDFIGEGTMVLGWCIDYYKPTYKSSFKTFLITSIRNWFFGMIEKSYRKHITDFTDADITSWNPSNKVLDPYKSAEISDKINSLSILEQKYIKYVTDPEPHIVSELSKINYKRDQKKRLRQLVCAELDISDNQEYYIRKNIEKCLTCGV